MNGLNQQIESQILTHFPPIRFAFAYGSGIFPQKHNVAGHDTMLDFIFAVDDAQSWHEANLRLHPAHYAPLPRFLGPSFVAWLQRLGPAPVYFNPYATLPSLPARLKYGVVAYSHLVDDLEHWSSLYFAGRLHKPVLPSPAALDPALAALLRANRAAAVLLALALRPAATRERPLTDLQLFERIAGISYLGDVRMALGAEHRHKAASIVQGHPEAWRALYGPILADLSTHELTPVAADDDGAPAQFTSALDLDAVRHRLPTAVQHSVAQTQCRFPALKDAALLSAAIANIIAPATRAQTLKGLISAGLTPSIRYVQAKFKKNF